MSEETVFDQIIKGEIPTKILYEDEHVMAFDDTHPQSPIHVLVIPKKKINRLENIEKLGVEDAGHFMVSLAKVAEKLGLNSNGYRVVINNGGDALQTVEYFHAHILGGRILSWPPG